ncbi:MAG: hypothetical protein HY744_23340 [Deltaproteobacteria bacterium]|nr:hypothetical protein [Deltaproteobacteria bacterium]
MLTALAQREVAGMKPEGWAPAGEFQQGQCHEHPFQLQPGRCYAAVGVGMGITEFDLEIAMQQAPYLKVRDRTRGSQPVLGGTMNCIRTPLLFGSPAKLILKATAGSGMGVAQLYSR